MKKIISFILVTSMLCSMIFTACGGGHTTHDYKATITDPTCTEQGFTTYTCQCGDSYVGDYVDALDHDYSEWVSNGDCTHSKVCNNDDSHIITEDCHGGQASEQERAICQDCNQPYGDFVSHTHNYNVLKYDAQSHWNECSCGEKQDVEIHKGGTATTTSKAVCEICNQEYGSVLLFKREGDYVYFGRFPQTIKKKDVTVSKYTNANGYYVGSDDAEYVKIISKYNCYDDCKLTDGSEIIKGEVYYVKLEPIRWRILDEEKGLIYCDSIIYNMYWDKEYSNYIGNNYKESDVRKWLNEDFINSAFTEEERAFIKTTLVDNSPASTSSSENKFACEDTLDKVFLLSAIEAKSISGDFGITSMRQLYTTDYCRLTSNTGVWLEERGRWWLRSPYQNRSDKVRYVRSIGDVNNLTVGEDDVGVVPALQIKL